MFKNILVPVDLTHLEALEKAVSMAGSIAKQSDAAITFVSVTVSAPSSVAHTPAEFAEKLSAYAAEQSAALGVTTGSYPVESHDPTADLDEKILAAIDATNADLVVMGTHVPGLADRLWASHGSTVARKAAISVFLVR